MKIVDVQEAKSSLSQLLVEVEDGEDVLIARNGTPVARLVRDRAGVTSREPGVLRAYPGWKDFVYDPAVFAPMTDADIADEVWP
jgi:hypothetical protein